MGAVWGCGYADQMSLFTDINRHTPGHAYTGRLPRHDSYPCPSKLWPLNNLLYEFVFNGLFLLGTY